VPNNKIQTTNKCQTNGEKYTEDGNKLFNEATELKKIFSSILGKSK